MTYDTMHIARRDEVDKRLTAIEAMAVEQRTRLAKLERDIGHLVVALGHYDEAMNGIVNALKNTIEALERHDDKLTQ